MAEGAIALSSASAEDLQLPRFGLPTKKGSQTRHCSNREVSDSNSQSSSCGGTEAQSHLHRNSWNLKGFRGRTVQDTCSSIICSEEKQTRIKLKINIFKQHNSKTHSSPAPFSGNKGHYLIKIVENLLLMSTMPTFSPPPCRSPPLPHGHVQLPRR